RSPVGMRLSSSSASRARTTSSGALPATFVVTSTTSSSAYPRSRLPYSASASRTNGCRTLPTTTIRKRIEDGVPGIRVVARSAEVVFAYEAVDRTGSQPRQEAHAARWRRLAASRARPALADARGHEAALRTRRRVHGHGTRRVLRRL